MLTFSQWNQIFRSVKWINIRDGRIPSWKDFFLPFDQRQSADLRPESSRDKKSCTERNKPPKKRKRHHWESTTKGHKLKLQTRRILQRRSKGCWRRWSDWQILCFAEKRKIWEIKMSHFDPKMSHFDPKMSHFDPKKIWPWNS